MAFGYTIGRVKAMLAVLLILLERLKKIMKRQYFPQDRLGINRFRWRYSY
jgi:hypothetical protein